MKLVNVLIRKGNPKLTPGWKNVIEWNPTTRTGTYRALDGYPQSFTFDDVEDAKLMGILTMGEARFLALAAGSWANQVYDYGGFRPDGQHAEHGDPDVELQAQKLADSLIRDVGSGR